MQERSACEFNKGQATSERLTFVSTGLISPLPLLYHLFLHQEALKSKIIICCCYPIPQGSPTVDMKRFLKPSTIPDTSSPMKVPESHDLSLPLHEIDLTLHQLFRHSAVKGSLVSTEGNVGTKERQCITD